MIQSIAVKIDSVVVIIHECQENKLLLSSINFTPKTNHSCRKENVTLTYIFQVSIFLVGILGLCRKEQLIYELQVSKQSSVRKGFFT